MSVYSNKSHIHKQVGQGLGGLTQELAIVEAILRDRQLFFDQIRESIELREKTRALLFSSSIFLAAYGAVLGSTHSLWQALSSAVKLPLLFLITLIICVPALYIFSVLFGSNQRLPQLITMVLSAITVTAVLLLSLAPVTFFFMLTTSDYQFFKLLNVFFFAIAGFVGMFFLSRGIQIITMADKEGGTKIRSIILYLWILLYGFVGSQMAWTLRPFVGYPWARFELIRELGGHFYTNVFYSIGEILGFLVVM
jgi:hypothetical protein